MFKPIRVLIIICTIGLLVTQFQNCAPEGAFEAASVSVDSIDSQGKFHVDPDPKIDPEIPKKTLLSFSQPLADRQLIESIFTNAFGPSFKAVDTVANVEMKALQFGPNCSLYTDYSVLTGTKEVQGPGTETCRITTQNFKVEMIAGATAPRASLLINACSQMVSHNTTLNHFLSKVGSASSRNSFSDQSLINAYKLFFIAKPAPSPELLQSLKFIGVSQTNPVKAWSAIAYTLCSSGHWQVL